MRSRISVAERTFVPSLPTLDPWLLVPSLEPRRRPSFPFDRLRDPAAGARLFYLARAGVYHAIRHFLAGKPGTVLVPAYHHGVEVEAVRAAGARIEFYRVDEQLHLDLEDVERRARAISRTAPPVRVVYVTHFVGFAQPVAEAAELAHRLGAALFEDCALALGSTDAHGRPLGSFGDAAVFCLYKTLPLPHGGLLIGSGLPPSPTPPAPPTISPPLASTLHHLAGSTLAHLELRSGSMGRALRAAARAAAHRTVDLLVETQRTGSLHLLPVELSLGASRIVERLVERIDLVLAVARRRHNFRRLADALDGVAPVLGAELPAGTCPLFLPILVQDKPALVRWLHAQGIDAIDFWSGGDPACDLTAFPEAAQLRRDLLELPCHQSLDDREIDRVAHAVKEGLAHAGSHRSRR